MSPPDAASVPHERLKSGILRCPGLQRVADRLRHLRAPFPVDQPFEVRGRGQEPSSISTDGMSGDFRTEKLACCTGWRCIFSPARKSPRAG